MADEKKLEKIIIYQGKSGAIEFRGDSSIQTIWGTQKQIAEVFGVNVRTVNEHLMNIYKTGELKEGSTIRNFRIVQQEGRRKVERKIQVYNLDTIISVGHRVNSKRATQFRIWATKVLKQHIVEGYTINRNRINKNFQKFTQAVADIKALLPDGSKVNTKDVLELINTFAGTWLSLDAYDTNSFPKKGVTKKTVSFTANELSQALQKLKKELISKKQAAEIFGQERSRNAVQGIIGNIFQSVFGKDVYPSTEKKAAHLLYFMVKNHPFVDGNKRSGAFTFVWFLNKSGLLHASLTPETLTSLTLLIAESRPKDKNKMIGLVMLLLK